MLAPIVFQPIIAPPYMQNHRVRVFGVFRGDDEFARIYVEVHSDVLLSVLILYSL